MKKPKYALRLAELRSEKEKTQQQVADENELTRGRLNNYEQGVREPDIETLRKLADYYKVTTDYLLGISEVPNILYPKNGTILINVENPVTRDRIRQKRKEKRLTQEELATLVNVSPQVISNWERGYTPEIGHDDLYRLAIALETSADYLLGRTDVDSPTIKTPDQATDDPALKEKLLKLAEYYKVAEDAADYKIPIEKLRKFIEIFGPEK